MRPLYRYNKDHIRQQSELHLTRGPNWHRSILLFFFYPKFTKPPTILFLWFTI